MPSGNHPGYGRWVKVHHTRGNPLIIELHSDQETELAVEIEQDLFAAKGHMQSDTASISLPLRSRSCRVSREMVLRRRLVRARLMLTRKIGPCW